MENGLTALRKTLPMLCLALALGSAVSAAALEQSPRSLFDQAVEAYKEGRYERALEQFRRINRDIESAGLFFNIGNCHVKLGERGRAVAAYSSALLRDPANADIRHNLRFVLEQTRDRIPGEESPRGIRDVLFNLIRRFPLRTHQQVFLALYLVLFAFLAAPVLLRKPVREFRTAIAVLGLFVVLDAGVLWLRYRDLNRPMGVVTAPKVRVRYGPSPDETEAFVLHEGARFRVYRRSSGWSQIRLSDGKSGWIPAQTFVPVK